MNITDWDRFRYDAKGDEALLVPLIEECLRVRPRDTKQWRVVLRKYPRPDGGFFSKTQIIAGFRALSADRDWGVEEPEFLDLLKMKPMRTQSGVVPVTVLTKPYPCPGQCIFCPNDVRMPKSYLSDEPGAQRATLNRFDPYAQTWNRLLAFYRMGHPVEKVELLVLGGTWSSYPRSYQLSFITRCFEAINDFGMAADPQLYIVPEEGRPDFLDLAHLEDVAPSQEAAFNSYNKLVSRHLRHEHEGKLLAEHERSEWRQLDAAHEANERARCRVVGLVIETRPDEIDPAEVVHLRRLGATKVQVGVQSMSDFVLAENRRGHDVEQARRAINLLRLGGFKIHVHWMANLFRATPESDAEDFERLFSDSAIRPDELKLYPCSLIPRTPLMTHYEAGEWRPYTREEMLELLCGIMPQTPRYCRLSRVIRDIPTTEMHAGLEETNFREVAERTLKARGIPLMDIRAREVGLGLVDDADLELRVLEYDTPVSREVFFSYEVGDQLLGFLRLSLPSVSPIHDALRNCAMIREVHVYGQSLGLGVASGRRAQHRGLGRKLVEAAIDRACDGGYAALAVISAVGTRPYYTRLGFDESPLYQFYDLRNHSADARSSQQNATKAT